MAIESALDEASSGRPLTREAALALMRASGSHLLRLLCLASALRDTGKGRTITFSKKVFIPLTRLCRDRCGYCTFRRDPGETGDGFMTAEEVLSIASAGARLGCKEALFSLGEKPELAFPEARRFLTERGHRTTIEYLARMCELTLEETGLLPHANPGTMTIDEMAMLRDANASMGLMLESVSARLMRPGGPHYPAPDKHPLPRLETIEGAGRLRIAFTTGILIGIGETLQERIDSLFAIKALSSAYGHVQEVIVQNFRAKPTIPMRGFPEPTLLDMLRTLAVARLILGAEMNLQAPPNLTPTVYSMLLLSGINDWGGISPLTEDFINPEAPWPQIAALQEETASLGYRLRERLAIYPEYIFHREGFIPPPLAPRIMSLVDDAGYPREEGQHEARAAFHSGSR
ncbi:MAG: 7,8-didemethyl-8-hydroxy-5-deazariboflavin synthase CofG [Candidatus Methylomirabilis oxyfera]|nr:7,8-didemethyl-8-hydroxy-5-deazariboflavin synthase CofG [Candidatus Methylomirabilis oxyfera]